MSAITIEVLSLATIFGFIALASRQIAKTTSKTGLPLISGYLLAGILAGPFLLGLLPPGVGFELRVLDEISLGFIAFAAGAELFLKDLRGHGRSIGLVTAGQLLTTFAFGAGTLYLLSDVVPFMQDLSSSAKAAIALLAGAILVARSPSSTIAVMDELRAKGPFTRTVLSVTVIKDVLVIVVFAISAAVAGALVGGEQVDLGLVGLLLLDLMLAAVLALGLWQLLQFILNRAFSWLVKVMLILGCGLFIFEAAAFLRRYTHDIYGTTIHLEPLLICTLAGFFVVNYGPHREQFTGLLRRASMPVYVVFFTLAGAAVELDVLLLAWRLALLLFFVRLLAVFLGSYIGGALAGDPPQHNRLSWMAYVTQAGVGLGLAKEVAVEFPTWGAGLATILIAVIVVNQIVGPPLFKWTIRRVGEDHERAEPHHFDGSNDAVIFGLEPQSVALAHQLESHGWGVRIAVREEGQLDPGQRSDLELRQVHRIDLANLEAIGVGQAEALVALLDDESNYRICELAYEHFGTPTVVVRVGERQQIARFRELGALIVDPNVAIISLLDHLVRSPSGASLLLGMHDNQDVIDVELLNNELDGVRVKDLRLPGDTLVLSLRRNGEFIVCHGYTRLRRGDWVTLVGSEDSLDRVSLKMSL